MDHVEGFSEKRELWCLEVKRWISFSTETRSIPLQLKEEEKDIGTVRYLVLILTPLGEGVWKRVGAGNIEIVPGQKSTSDPLRRRRRLQFPSSEAPGSWGLSRGYTCINCVMQ